MTIYTVQGGGGLVHQLKKSYSLTDLSSLDAQDDHDHGRTRAISYSVQDQQQDNDDEMSDYSRKYLVQSSLVRN